MIRVTVGDDFIIVDENCHLTVRSWFLINLKPLKIKIKLAIIRTVYVYTFLAY